MKPKRAVVDDNVARYWAPKVSPQAIRRLYETYELPHALSRHRAVHFVAIEYQSEEGPPHDFALELMKKATRDKNWRVRKTAATRLLFSRIFSQDERTEQLIPIVLGRSPDE